MFDIGFQELVIIFLVALLVFGPKKLPEVGRTLGKWIVDIRKGVQSVKSQVENEFGEEYKRPDADIVESLPKPDDSGEQTSLPEDEKHREK